MLLLPFTACNSQIKNAKTETVKIYGNCEMCEATIEKAGNKKAIAQVDWNKDTKTATIIYDEKKTNLDEVLKRIALSGYDNQKFLAPNDAYVKLPECCQYQRKTQPEAKGLKIEIKEDHATHNHTAMIETKQDTQQLKAIFDNYFMLKDALVKTDGNTASVKSKEMLMAINAIKMEKLSIEEHAVWMKVMKDLAFETEHIANTKDVSHQRDHFTTLSKNMYVLTKASKMQIPIYYQFCPMANDGKGATWLSKENVVKNPYYGSTMLSCGKVTETTK